MCRIVLLGVTMLAGMEAAVVLAQDAPVTHVVVIDDAGYHPGSIVVHPGDSVKWVNRRMAASRAYAVDDPDATVRGIPSRAFDTGPIPPGQESRPILFPAIPGRPDYQTFYWDGSPDVTRAPHGFVVVTP